MRESRTKDKTHLPADTTEIWLEAQKGPSTSRSRHRNPPEDSFESWMEKRVDRVLNHKRISE